MKGFALAAAWVALISAPVLAQNPPAGQKPQPTTPAPATPAAPAPAQPAPAPQPPAPFPQGAKAAYVNLQSIAQRSADGKAAATKVNALIQKKQSEAAEKNKALQASQQKLSTGGSVLSESARAQLQKDIEKMQVEAQRFEQDAQAEINDMQQQLQGDFQRKLIPILEQIAKEKSLNMLFSGADAGLIWADPGLDLTDEAVKRLDAATSKPAPAAAPAATPQK
jgi:Skp family chaperone for outer membrane proteins